MGPRLESFTASAMSAINGRQRRRPIAATVTLSARVKTSVWRLADTLIDTSAGATGAENSSVEKASVSVRDDCVSISLRNGLRTAPGSVETLGYDPTLAVSAAVVAMRVTSSSPLHRWLVAPRGFSARRSMHSACLQGGNLPSL
jgi:hypothetical protein